ncbi:sensor histidine kinase [Sulfurimonas sp.]|uniref:sensor histidine kinase n=1 Tax=Sulfurimonas sp. TaxID=2022749 RepID=UPI00356472D2
MSLLENFLKSGFDFDDKDFIVEGKYRVTNMMLLLFISGLIFGILTNVGNPEKYYLIKIELSLIVLSLLMIYVLRLNTKYFSFIQTVFLLKFSIFFSFLFYISDLYDMKFLWIFLYPLILLNIQSEKNVKYWFILMVVSLSIVPYQPFVDVAFSKSQMLYVVIAFVIESLVVYFYHTKMSYAANTIVSQREKLENKLEELTKKDKMLSTQSKQAVMGEMMSMIAHQWRQPLSGVTLQISNLQFEKMLGNKISDEKLEKTLNSISDTLVYLSETVDDFQTYFHPKKTKSKVEIHEVLNKAINFAKARADSNKINIEINKSQYIDIVTYENELIQIILNLINNAIDALISHEEDKDLIISIRVENFYNSIKIYVTDNGIGISSENIERVFEPYFSTKDKNGTGLGLYMSQIIAQKQFDGGISVSSSGSGTTFIVEIKKDVNF